MSGPLVCRFEEDVDYGGAPPQVLAALARVKARLDKYEQDEPGDYYYSEPEAVWHSQNLKSSWRICVSVFREERKPVNIAVGPSGAAVASHGKLPDFAK